MNLFRGRLLAAAAALLAVPAFASAAINVNIDSTSLSQSAGVQNFALDVTFSNDGASQSFIGYDAGLLITSASTGLNIVGVGTGANLVPNSVLPGDPAFIANGGAPYLFSRVESSAGSIDNGDGMLRILLQAAANTTGTFQISFFQDSQSGFDTKLYADAGLNEIPGATFGFGTVTINAIPEPAAMSLALFALPLLARRRVR